MTPDWLIKETRSSQPQPPPRATSIKRAKCGRCKKVMRVEFEQRVGESWDQFIHRQAETVVICCGIFK